MRSAEAFQEPDTDLDSTPRVPESVLQHAVALSVGAGISVVAIDCAELRRFEAMRPLLEHYGVTVIALTFLLAGNFPLGWPTGFKQMAIPTTLLLEDRLRRAIRKEETKKDKKRAADQ